MTDRTATALLEALFASSPAFERAAGFVDRSDRAAMRVRGGDRTRFLNAMLTNDVDREAGVACPVALLDRKGHVLAEGGAFVGPDAVVIESTPESPMREVLEKHVIADDVEIDPLDFGQLSIEGSGAVDALREGGIAVPPPERFVLVDGLIVAAGGWLGGETGARLLGPREALGALVERLGIAEIPAESAEIARIVAGLGRYGVDLGPRNFPQEARLDAALCFTKGCFVGQEIVARIRSRGAVNRLLVRLELGAASQADAPIALDGRKIGHVTSAAALPDGGFAALGYVGAEFAAAGTEVDVDGVGARVLG